MKFRDLMLFGEFTETSLSPMCLIMRYAERMQCIGPFLFARIGR